ncbi:MAG TPA: glucose 1-dehydrogenase [Chloroflexota bacterium]|jgi:3-oxoacyl-[acyl-carrier protein] reductase|nr:glucose 1-dehydrogenase [Chloroflexota bacterium]
MAIGIDLGGKTALVTGSSRGLGAAIARRLAAAGAAVAVHYAAGAERAAALVTAIEGAGGRAVAVGGNFHDAPAIERAMAEVQQHFGHIDILVNNVGREEQLGPALELGWDAYQGILDLNLRAAYLTSRAVAPGMRERKGGRIINILSMALHGQPRSMAAYSTAKGALHSFTQALAVDLGPDNITVNAVSPGWIPVERHGPSTLPGRAATAARTPLGHLGTPDDVAGAVLFLASDLANFITGVEIPVCGGVQLLQ